jgi:hypothetical protein
VTGSGGVRLERWGAFLLLSISAGATWWLSENAQALATVTNLREEQLEHIDTLVVRNGEPATDRSDELGSFHGVFPGQRVVWRDSGVGRVLTLQVLDGAEGDR